MSEEIGKKLAAQYGKSVSANNAQVIANQNRAAINSEIQSRLKSALSGAVSAFNQHSGSPILLKMVAGENQLIFNLAGKLTLTLIFRDQKVEVNPPKTNQMHTLPYAVDVYVEAESLRFRVIPSFPTINPPTRSQDEFVESILKIALEEKPD